MSLLSTVQTKVIFHSSFLFCLGDGSFLKIVAFFVGVIEIHRHRTSVEPWFRDVSRVGLLLNEVAPRREVPLNFLLLEFHNSVVELGSIEDELVKGSWFFTVDVLFPDLFS